MFLRGGVKAALGGLSLIALLSGGGFGAATTRASRPEDVKVAFPEGLETETIFKLPKGEPRPPKVLFRVDHEGTPYMLIGRRLIAAKHSDDSRAEAFSLGKGEAINDLVWMSDGILLLVEGNRLMISTPEGLKPVQVLPGPGMRLAAASEDSVYLFGGDDPEQRTKLYIYKAGGKLLHLMKAESPISAAAGDGKVTFVAIDKGVYRLEPGVPLAAALLAQAPVTSLTLGPKSTFFYSTSKGTGFSDGRRGGSPFVIGEGAEVQVRGELFYLFFPKDVAIIKGRPVSSFLKALGAR